MDAELEKLVEAGKLTANAAEQLENLNPGHLLPAQKLGLRTRGRVESSAQPDPDRFRGQEGASDAALPYGGAFDGYSRRTFPWHGRQATRRGLRTNEKRSGRVGAQSSRRLRRRRDAYADQRPCWLVTFLPKPNGSAGGNATTKALKKEGLFSAPGEKTEPFRLRAGSLARRRVGDCLRTSPTAERADRGARSNHPNSRRVLATRRNNCNR